MQVLRTYSAASNLQLVEVAAAQEQAAINIYTAAANVEYAEPDYLTRSDSVPDDPDFGTKTWALHNIGQALPYVPGEGCSGCPDERTEDADIDAPEAWDIWVGDDNFRVAVIDTGIDLAHPDLVENIWTNLQECPGGTGNCITDGIDDDNNGKVDDFHGWNFGTYPEDNDLTDRQVHGVGVAGIIAARGNNGVGVLGVNWRAKLVTLKTSFSGTGCALVSSHIAAIQYCIDNNIKVSNNSWSLGIHCQSLYDVIKAARDQIGHIVVASAGNLNRNNDSIPHYPSNYGWTHEYAGETIVGLDNVIAVAGTDNDDNLFSSDAGASNYGADSVHLAAPGFNIWTTRLSRTASEYGYFQATSEAAPAVVKAAAPDHRVRGHCKRACRPGGAVRT